VLVRSCVEIFRSPRLSLLKNDDLYWRLAHVKNSRNALITNHIKHFCLKNLYSRTQLLYFFDVSSTFQPPFLCKIDSLFFLHYFSSQRSAVCKIKSAPKNHKSVHFRNWNSKRNWIRTLAGILKIWKKPWDIVLFTVGLHYRLSKSNYLYYTIFQRLKGDIAIFRLDNYL
jgi:hypothetical protein